MQFRATYCKVIGNIWLVVTGLLIVVGIAEVWMKEDLSGVQDLLSPFNVVNYIAMAITLGITTVKGNSNQKYRVA